MEETRIRGQRLLRRSPTFERGSAFALFLALAACTGSQAGNTSTRLASTVVSASEADWEQLNPARGDASPMAATLWGDRHGRGPTGFLFHPVDGFESPPHAHNVSYRGVVIRGLVHNADPKAARSWMPAGSFWTQPKGGVHITAAKGNDVLAYIEIDEGPYLVLPVDEAFDVEETAINTRERDIAWTELRGLQPPVEGLSVARLWGDDLDSDPNGFLLKLPAGFSGGIRAEGASFRAVVIRGRSTMVLQGQRNGTPMEPGSYFSSEGESIHRVSVARDEECILYVRSEGRFHVVPAQPVN